MKTPVSTATCPANSQLRRYLNKVDFEDAYAFSIPSGSEPIDEVYLNIFNTAPLWIEYAMRFRNLLVAPFGLKTEIERREISSLRVGEKAGIFKIYSISENEVIAGEDDKHLNFRVSVHRETKRDSRITVSTMVQYNNSFGRMYMTLIAPIHKLVVRSILSSSARRF